MEQCIDCLDELAHVQYYCFKCQEEQVKQRTWLFCLVRLCISQDRVKRNQSPFAKKKKKVFFTVSLEFNFEAHAGRLFYINNDIR